MFQSYQIDKIIDEPPHFAFAQAVNKTVHVSCASSESDPKESGGQYWKSYYSLLIVHLGDINWLSS